MLLINKLLWYAIKNTEVVRRRERYLFHYGIESGKKIRDMTLKLDNDMARARKEKH